MPPAFIGSFGVPVDSDLSTYLSNHKGQKEITMGDFRMTDSAAALAELDMSVIVCMDSRRSLHLRQEGL